MSEESAFWKQVSLAAVNLALEIIVEKDGRMSLRHKKAWGDPERPSDDEVATFRAFLARNRAMILKANCIDAPDPVGDDARRFKAWLESQNGAGDCRIRGKSGREYLFCQERDRLLKHYKEEPGWVLQAYRFQKAVKEQVGWSDPNAEKPEIWQ